MASMLDQIRASKLPSNMMQFAARGALQVSPAENIEILVHLAVHNKVFGDLAKMTLAGWDEKSSLVAASDPKTPREVLQYLISPDNVRPKLLPALLVNPSVAESSVAKFAISASRESIEMMLKSARVRSLPSVLKTLRSNPYLKKEEAAELQKLGEPRPAPNPAVPPSATTNTTSPAAEAAATPASANAVDDPSVGDEADAAPDPEADEVFSAYLAEHAAELAEEGDKPFQAIGGIVELLGADYFPVTQVVEAPEAAAPAAAVAAAPTALQAATAAAAARKAPAPAGVRENALQKVNRLDV